MFENTFFIGNRQRLAEKVPDSFIVIPAHSQMQKSADEPFPFRQDSSFWYLTGIDEPDLVLLLDTASGVAEILLPEQNDYQRIWEGENKQDEFKETSGITKYANKALLYARLKSAKNKGLAIAYLQPLKEVVEPFGFYSNPARSKLAEQIKKVEQKPTDVRKELARLRQVKQPCEIKVIRQAINITVQTLQSVQSRLESFATEKDIERAIGAGFYANGGDGHAFQPIVACGKNATTIHYQKNTAPLSRGKLVMIDVGARSNHYAADISSTWMLGTPTKRQREIYEVVADIQQYVLGIIKPGITIGELQAMADDYANTCFEKHNISQTGIPHLVSHYLGLDVHDAGDYDTPLEPGCLITVEPGIYLPEEGIGVRIEDDVLVTKRGIENLSYTDNTL